MIRPATQADVEAMAAVQLHAALVGYAGLFPPDAPVPTAERLAELWREELWSPAAVRVAVDGNDAVVGTVAVRDGWLRRLYVEPTCWGGGVGAELHDAAVVLGARELRVLAGNDRARRFYERRGWQLVEGSVVVLEPLDVVEVHYRR